MALTYSVLRELGKPAPDFSLKGVDGKIYGLADFARAKALAVIFMCNHCPYVIATQDRINRLAKTYAARGLALVRELRRRGEGWPVRSDHFDDPGRGPNAVWNEALSERFE